MASTAAVLLLTDAWLQTKGGAWGWRVLRVLATAGFLAVAANNLVVGARQ